MDNTNADRQRRWQSRHVIRASLSADEIADRLRAALDQDKLARVADLLGAGEVPPANDDAAISAAQPIDQETMRAVSGLFRTLNHRQLKSACAVMMRRLRIVLTAEVSDKELRRQVVSLRARLRKATHAAKMNR